MTRTIGITTFFLLLSLGCSDDSQQAATAEQGADEPATSVVSEAPKATEPPETAPSGEPQRVSFETEDGVTIVGTLRPGGRPNAPAAILVHRLSSSREQWKPVVDRLVEPPGLTTLAIDMRGHGDSTSGAKDQELSWRDFEDAQWKAISADVTAAVDFLEQREGLDPRRIVAVGSSIGSSAVIVAASKDERIDAIAAISPGRAYRGVDALSPTEELGKRPLLAIAAKEEESAAQAARDMARIAGAGNKQLYPGSAHGLAIAEQSPEMIDALVGFVRGKEAGE